ncbi:MAG: GNAT family N-acetyltransferase [Brevundimonas sp.]|uniref:GNAT family N-acetyltransferase n=1 Tax=Brevundimonas sp. TaxID=1871086 RepID=UPI0017BE844D|nr:GNAT family protein [Brevundimonas sp.]MBA4803194.1 GNAT family N-acetyltransferase [Brevundimonas sp.]
MEIVTPRLKLRSARTDDLAAMHAVLSDARATRWWSTPPHASLDETAAWLDSMIANGPRHPDFVIERNGAVIGKVGFWKPPEIGYILHPDHWGQGLAFEAAAAAIAHVFATLPFAELTADVDPDNAGSIRLLEKLGFVRTGFGERTWNVGGEWKDSVYYALARTAWEAAQSTSTQPSPR